MDWLSQLVATSLPKPGGANSIFCFVWLGGLGMVLWLLLRRRSSRCGRCGEVNRPAAVFCAQCGQRLVGR